MEKDYGPVIEEIFRGVEQLIGNGSNLTKIYNGLLLKDNGDNTWQVQYNSIKHDIPHYGDFTPKVGKSVKVFIPQGNENLKFFI